MPKVRVIEVGRDRLVSVLDSLGKKRAEIAGMLGVTDQALFKWLSHNGRMPESKWTRLLELQEAQAKYLRQLEKKLGIEFGEPFGDRGLKPGDIVIDEEDLDKFSAILSKATDAVLVRELEKRGWQVVLKPTNTKEDK